ncbi:MAG TPA: carboxymuconolactone decarboxylase family protein [Abditibacteriaceae bacterium]
MRRLSAWALCVVNGAALAIILIMAVSAAQAQGVSQGAVQKKDMVRTARTGQSTKPAQQAQHVISQVSRLELASLESAALQQLKNADLLEPAATGHIPNYLRAIASTMPDATGPLAHLVKTALYGGTLPPQTRMAMGLRIAAIHNNEYVAAHLRRLLRAQSGGPALISALQNNATSKLSPPMRLALRYAEQLTRDIHGVSDADFAEVRRFYNDSQLVDLTMMVSFFNYFNRLCQGLQLPLEPWITQPVAGATALASTYQAPQARVALISDEEFRVFGTVASPPAPAVSPAPATVTNTSNEKATEPKTNNGLGIKIANSQRAMSRVPDFSSAWFGYWAAVRQSATLDRPLLLQVSFAVSMVNGCRYCTLHQVQGLRRSGVDMEKLVAMKKDDSALTARELTAVQFARKLTRDAASVSNADYRVLEAEFGRQGALEVLLQTCAFNFMNRFTDGLRLPSEDEAVQTYREVYKSDWRK